MVPFIYHVHILHSHYSFSFPIGRWEWGVGLQLATTSTRCCHGHSCASVSFPCFLLPLSVSVCVGVVSPPLSLSTHLSIFSNKHTCLPPSHHPKSSGQTASPPRIMVPLVVSLCSTHMRLVYFCIDLVSLPACLRLTPVFSSVSGSPACLPSHHPPCPSSSSHAWHIPSAEPPPGFLLPLNSQAHLSTAASILNKRPSLPVLCLRLGSALLNHDRCH